MNDRAPASDALSTMTHEELMIFADILHTQFAATYAQAQQEIATARQVSRPLYHRLVQLEGLHTEVVHALQLDLLEQEINLGHEPT